MTGKRKRYSAEFKAKVALDAIRGEQTIAQLAAKYAVHQKIINAWKKQAIEGMSGVFSGKAEAAEAAREGEIDQLHAKIGQLVVERDFLRRASRSLALHPSFDPTLWMLAAANAHLGRMDEARRFLERLRSVAPDVTIAKIWSGHPQKDPSRMANILDGLRLAGLE